MTHPLAGQPVPPELLTDVTALIECYRTERPDASNPHERVGFGTSGHRGSSLSRTFNEAHIVAICAALVEHRRGRGIGGPLFLGRDTHALSEPAFATAVEVFAAHDVAMVIEVDSPFTATPILSHAILTHNARSDAADRADGVVITPSHNPPADGGFKYNPPTGGPADTSITAAIQTRANQLLEDGVSTIRRTPIARASAAATRVDLAGAYIADLASVLDLAVVSASGLRIGVDPMGGAAIDVWARIAERYALELEVTNPAVDPTFSFMPLDWDGRIRMDCSSPHAMAGLLALRDRYDVAFGNDPDADRHGIVTPRAGLLNPNHYLAVAIDYLLQHRPDWPGRAAIGKTLVSSAMIDRVAKHHRRDVLEVPVGFKWFVDGLLDGSIVFGGEESAGASFVRRDGSAWTTDKDGILLGLLAAEITARTGSDPAERYAGLTARFGTPHYARVDAAATPEEKQRLAVLAPDDVTAAELAGERIIGRLTHAPGNDAPIGGLKVATDNGWFAARPSGTEDVYKIYAESFIDAAHLTRIQDEARGIVAAALSAGD